jgi:hypothetical protein
MEAQSTPAPGLPAEFAPGPENPIGEPPVPRVIDWTRPVRTMNKFPVRILAIDYSLCMPVVGIIQYQGAGRESVATWTTEGRFDRSGRDTCCDLENIPTPAAPAPAGGA